MHHPPPPCPPGCTNTTAHLVTAGVSSNRVHALGDGRHVLDVVHPDGSVEVVPAPRVDTSWEPRTPVWQPEWDSLLPDSDVDGVVDLDEALERLLAEERWGRGERGGAA